MRQFRGKIVYLFLFVSIAYLGFSPISSVGALEVDKDELEKSGSSRVEFINYEGPHARIETLEQIRTIGYSLGLSVKNSVQRPGAAARYFVIHSVSGPEGDKLDADIFGLGIDTGVDHIRNLRLIIQGYLQGAYDYSARDAALLAEYVTIYNAVFRGDWDYFGSRYKGPVMQNLVPEKAGISVRFDEWPGKTLMIIPLASGSSGSLSAVDTSSLTHDQVLEEMRKDEDKGIDQRKDMVDLKEREAAEAEQKASMQREAIAEEEKRIAEERETLRREQERIAEERRQQTQQEPAVTPAQREEQRKTEEDLTQRESQTAEKEQELAQREEKLDEQRQQAEQSEQFAEQKAEEARQEREGIAQDQQQIISQEDARASEPGGIIGMRVSSQDSPLGRVVRVNPSSGTELRTSALNTVNGRTLAFSGSRILAVAGENRGSGAIRLVEINPDTLEMVKQGDDDIHPDSLLWMNGSSIYALTVSSGNCYLARFNLDLVRQARSSSTVHPFASILFQGSNLLTQRNDGSVLILNPNDLSEIK
ncbi:hypothetical protein LJC14_05475 [Treponema sp. OttesenSCG-928-L16]|nr:hypothetical protein [Treponema sp. OttesenSCG-928-L16]